MRRRTLPLALAATAALTAGAGVLTALPASAAAGCGVAYSVTSSWPGGFGVTVTVTNLGDPLTSWTLGWSFANGQTVTQAWNTTLTQSGSQVTAKNAGYNGSIATNGTTSFGFNGSWTGTNAAPTAFTLNGTACTGATTPTTPTASPTASPTVSPTSSPTTSPTASPTTSAPATGVPADAAWVDSGQWATWTNGGYTLYNDVWGSGAGTQTIWARTGTNWGVIANHPRTSGVKSYPNTGQVLNRTLSSLTSVTSSFNVTVPSAGDYETTYDIWANNNAYEIMLWVNQSGAVGPIAESYDANGPVPTVKNLTVGGQTWNVYRGSNGANAVYSFVRTSNTTSGTIDVLAVLNWLRTNGWWADVTVGALQFGFELTGTAGQSAFTSNSFAISYR
jgi:hypothetical protein